MPMSISIWDQTGIHAQVLGAEMVRTGCVGRSWGWKNRENMTREEGEGIREEDRRKGGVAYQLASATCHVIPPTTGMTDMTISQRRMVLATTGIMPIERMNVRAAVWSVSNCHHPHNSPQFTERGKGSPERR